MKKKIIILICIILSLATLSAVVISAKKNNDKLEKKGQSIAQLAEKITSLEMEKKKAEEEA